MKETIMHIVSSVQNFLDNTYYKVKMFINSYEYNYPLIISISIAVIILIIIFKIMKRKKSMRMQTHYKEIPDTSVGERIPQNEVSESISEIDKIVEETISDVDNENNAVESENFMEDKKLEDSNEDINIPEKVEASIDIPEKDTAIPIAFVDSLKQDLETEFINLVKRNFPFFIDFNKDVLVSEDILNRGNYIIDKLDKLKEKYNFLEEYYISTAIFYFYTFSEDKAFEILSEGIKKYEKSSKLLIEKARILIHRNRIEDAKKMLLQAKEINPADFDSYLLLGEIYFKENRFSDALDIYKKVILLDTQNSTAFAYKGYLLAKKGFISDGERDLKKAIALDYKNSIAYYMLGDVYLESGNYSKSIMLFNKAKKFNCSIKDIDSKLAVAYYKIDKYTAVISLLKKYHTDDKYLKTILGESYYKLDLFDDACNVYESLFNAEKDESKKIEYLNKIIEIYKKKNDIDNILKYLKVKLEKESDNLNILKEIGDIYYFHLKNNTEAKKYYEKILENDKNFDVIYHLINIYFKERNYKKCIELYKEIENREAIIPEIFYKVGLSFFKERNYDNAIQLLSKAEITGWVDEELYNALGFSYLKTKHFNKSEESFQKALTINPYNSQIHNNLGTIYAQREQFKEAVTEFKKALELDPDNKDILYNLYRVYKILSKSEAEKYLTKLEEVI